MIIQSQLKKLINFAFSPRYLFVTNTTICVASLVGADYIQQLTNRYLHSSKAIEKLNHNNISVYDSKRSIGMAVGGLFGGTVYHYWYKFLDRKFPGKSIATVSKKLLCEGIASPFFATAFYYIVARTEGKSTAEWYNSFKNNARYIVLADWCFFMPLQAFNFLLLPPQYRYLFVGVASIFYDYFLTYIYHK